MPNALYYGDNLEVLRNEIASESVDLIYLDPPFNSQASYNVLFRSPLGAPSAAQIEAFDDTWHWGTQAEQAFDEVLTSTNTDAAQMLHAMRSFLGENDMMAYLAMMAVRLVELHRAMKLSGSLYLHCDPTASHYLKILMDAVFGKVNFRNEIIWQRTTGKSLMTRRLPDNHDIILCYQRTDSAVWNANEIFIPYDRSALPEKTADKYKYRDVDGRLYRLDSLINPNRDRPNLTYEFLGVQRVWRWTKSRMQAAYNEGLVVQTKPGMVPQLKRYLHEQRGLPIGDVWADIPPLNSQAQERLGYPTQKPLALLERIIRISSRPAAVILDPFCGCGTAVHAAQKLGRQWIGIDVTHLAISLIEKRLNDAFPGITFEVHGTPKDLDGARDLAQRDKYQFQWWAVSLVNAQPYGGKKKGADRGIDGLIFFRTGRTQTERAIVSVKGGENVGINMVRELRATLEREHAPVGILILLNDPTRPMEAEAAAAGFFTAADAKYPRLQILTIRELFQGMKPKLPPIDTMAAFRKSPRERVAHVQEELAM